MSSKSVIACLAASAFVATTALMPTDASAGRGGLQPGTWNWPPYPEGGNMPRTTCGYVWVNPDPYSPGFRGDGFTSAVEISRRRAPARSRRGR
jgi:hypothetical protein